MKRIFAFLLLTFLINSSFSQTNNNSFVLLRNGDSITNITIDTKKSATNESFVKYTDTLKNTYRIEAAKVNKYFDGNFIFNSENIKDNFKFIYYYATGYISIGISFKNNGDQQFWLKTEGNIIKIPNEQDSLISFFKHNLKDFDQFIASKPIKVEYSYKYLGEIASSYNAFKFPKKYVAVDYSSRKKYSIGLFSNPLILTNTEFNSSFQIGASLKFVYSPSISINLSPSYYKNETDNIDYTLYLKTFNTDFSVNFNALGKKNTSIELGLGLGIIYHYNTLFILKNMYANTKPVSLNNPLSISAFSAINIYILKNLSINLSIHKYRVEDMSVDPIYSTYGIDTSPVKMIDFRVGLSYQLFRFNE